jgi:hypothetical protein
MLVLGAGRDAGPDMWSTRSLVGAPRKTTLVLADQRMKNVRALEPLDYPAWSRHATLA